MSKITVIEGNSNDKDNVRVIMVKGEQGYSAYDLYVQNGGTLTEEQWLDAFLNAENFYNKDEVDTSQASQNQIISKKPYFFNNVVDMKSYNLQVGEMAITKGYYSVNDGGNAEYFITNIQETNDIQITLNNGLYATLIINDMINVKKIGAKGDGETDDTQAIQKAIELSISFATGNPKIECKSIYFPNGKYKINKLAFDVFHEPRIKGLTFYGDGRDSSILYIDDLEGLDIENNANATYLFDSQNYDAFQHFTFYDICFDTKNVGGILRLNSLQASNSSNNHFNFNSCQFITGTLFRADGDFTGDFEAFNNCVCTTYGDSIILNNAQSVCHYLYNCSFICYKNFISILSNGGGDIAINSTSIIMLNSNDETTGRYALNLNNANNIGQSNGNYNFNLCRFEFARYRGQVITNDTDIEAFIQFNSCQFNNRYGSTFQGVVAKKRKTILFNCCTLSNFISYIAYGTKLDTTPGTIIFDKCIEPNTILKTKCSVDGTGRIIANNLINSLASTAGNKCRDFDIGWNSYQSTIIPASVKTIPLSFSNENIIRSITIPENSYLIAIDVLINPFGDNSNNHNLVFTINTNETYTETFKETEGINKEISVKKILSDGIISISYNGNLITGSNAVFLARYI